MYASTRSACTQLADGLKTDGVAAAAYHAGLSNAERERAQRGWMDGVVKVVVATVA